MTSLATLITRYGVDVDDHLDRDELVPTLTGLQLQGDVAVIPTRTRGAGRAVPAAGVPVVRGENGGNTHLLLPGPGVTWEPATGGGNPLDLGTLTVGSVAYLAHPEHGYLGVGPGTYTIRRQREQADAIRTVND